MTINMTLLNEIYKDTLNYTSNYTSSYQDIQNFVKYDTTYEIFCSVLMFTTVMIVYDYFKNSGKTEIYEKRLMHARTAYELKRNELCTLKETVLKVLKTYYKQNTPDENVERLLKDLGVDESYFTEPPTKRYNSRIRPSVKDYLLSIQFIESVEVVETRDPDSGIMEEYDILLIGTKRDITDTEKYLILKHLKANENDIVFQTVGGDESEDNLEDNSGDNSEDNSEDEHETPRPLRRNPKRSCAPTSFVCENSFDVLEDDEEKDEEKDE